MLGLDAFLWPDRILIARYTKSSSSWRYLRTQRGGVVWLDVSSMTHVQLAVSFVRECLKKRSVSLALGAFSFSFVWFRRCSRSLSGDSFGHFLVSQSQLTSDFRTRTRLVFPVAVKFITFAIFEHEISLCLPALQLAMKRSLFICFPPTLDVSFAFIAFILERRSVTCMQAQSTSGICQRISSKHRFRRLQLLYSEPAAFLSYQLPCLFS